MYSWVGAGSWGPWGLPLGDLTMWLVSSNTFHDWWVAAPCHMAVLPPCPSRPCCNTTLHHLLNSSHNIFGCCHIT